LVARAAVAQRAAQVQAELGAAVEGADHRQVEQALVAARERVAAPAGAPAVLGDQALEVAREVVGLGVGQGLVDVVRPDDLAPDLQAALEDLLAHERSSSATTGLVSVPRPSTVTFTSSPGLRNH